MTNFTQLFPSQAEANITSVQPDKSKPNNLLVTTDTDVYSVPMEGNDGAEHISGKQRLYIPLTIKKVIGVAIVIEFLNLA